MAEIKAQMKERMAAVKAKEKQKVAQLKALKASQAPAPASALAPKPVSMHPLKRRDPAPAAAEEPSALPQGFFDASSGTRAEDVPAQTRADAGSASPAAPAAAQPREEAPAGGAVDLGLAYGSSGDEDESGDEDGGAQKDDEGGKEQESAKAVGALPDGFFDDKKKDAKAHNREAPKELDMDEMLAEFDNEIEKDVEALDKFEDEQVQKQVAEREKEEKEEAEEMESRVRQLRNAKMELLNKRKAEAGAAVGAKKRKFAFDDDEEEDDDESDDDGDDMLDWRRMAV